MRKQLTYALWAVALMVGMLSCTQDEVVPTQKKQLLKNYSWDIPSYTELRANEATLRPDRFLGKGFDVTHYAYNDAGGFSKYAILDLSSGAWSPFGRFVEEEVFLPIVEDYPDQNILRKYHQKISKRTGSDTITFSASASYKSNSIAYTHQDVKTQEDKSHTYSSFVAYPMKSVMYDLVEPTSLEFYLHKRFVRDLRVLPAKDLVQKYGSHLVTYYTTGAYMNLTVSAKSSIFREEEIKKIEGKIWDSKFKLSREIKNKIEQNIANIAVTYKQGGSDYVPEKSVLSLGTFYQDATVESLSEKEWYSKIRRDDNSFLALAEDGQGLVPIADLISDVPLKIKYVSGLIERTKPAGLSAINYVLCNPKTLKPFSLKGQILRVALPSYTKAIEQIALGIDNLTMLSEGMLLGREERSHKFNFEIGQDGLWTITSRLSQKYLCTDGVLRTLEEDTDGLRYWLLNPVIPTPEGNTRKLSQLFIQAK